MHGIIAAGEGLTFSPEKKPKVVHRYASSLKPLPDGDNLQFGKIFTDHCFFSDYNVEKGWHNWRIEPFGTVALSPSASVFHYGQDLFEGLKAYKQPNGQIALFRPEFNCRRMQAGAERLCLPAPTRELFMTSLKELISVDARWVPTAQGSSLYIRPTLIGTEPHIKAQPSKEAMYFVILSPVGAYFSGQSQPVRIWVEENAVRAVPGGLGATKAGANYAASFQSAVRANKNGCDQVLWLDAEHEGIEEVGTMNVFWVLKGEIVTPALNGSILPGSTREAVIELLKSRRMPIVERRITISELLKHHSEGRLLEAFGTGTAAVISPIGELHFRGRDYTIQGGDVGGVTRMLYETITNVQYGKAEDTLNWMVPLESLI